MESIVSISLNEFKTFLWQSLGDSQAFVNTYWAKNKNDSQYHKDDFLDWATYFRYLQAVLREFNSIAASNDDNLIQYFRKGLRPSIRA